MHKTLYMASVILGHNRSQNMKTTFTQILP